MRWWSSEDRPDDRSRTKYTLYQANLDTIVPNVPCISDNSKHLWLTLCRPLKIPQRSGRLWIAAYSHCVFCQIGIARFYANEHLIAKLLSNWGISCTQIQKNLRNIEIWFRNDGTTSTEQRKNSRPPPHPHMINQRHFTCRFSYDRVSCAQMVLCTFWSQARTVSHRSSSNGESIRRRPSSKSTELYLVTDRDGLCFSASFVQQWSQWLFSESFDLARVLNFPGSWMTGRDFLHAGAANGASNRMRCTSFHSSLWCPHNFLENLAVRPEGERVVGRRFENLKHSSGKMSKKSNAESKCEIPCFRIDHAAIWKSRMTVYVQEIDGILGRRNLPRQFPKKKSRKKDG